MNAQLLLKQVGVVWCFGDNGTGPEGCMKSGKSFLQLVYAHQQLLSKYTTTVAGATKCRM
jgi:hypothetical protein